MVSFFYIPDKFYFGPTDHHPPPPPAISLHSPTLLSALAWSKNRYISPLFTYTAGVSVLSKIRDGSNVTSISRNAQILMIISQSLKIPNGVTKSA